MPPSRQYNSGQPLPDLVEALSSRDYFCSESCGDSTKRWQSPSAWHLKSVANCDSSCAVGLKLCSRPK
jgi:hypothetical protein